MHHIFMNDASVHVRKEKEIQGNTRSPSNVYPAAMQAVLLVNRTVTK